MLEGLSGTIEISELYRKYRITTTMFYSWKEKLLENSATVFNDRNEKPGNEMEKLREELGHSRGSLWIIKKRGRSGYMGVIHFSG